MHRVIYAIMSRCEQNIKHTFSKEFKSAHACGLRETCSKSLSPTALLQGEGGMCVRTYPS